MLATSVDVVVNVSGNARPTVDDVSARQGLAAASVSPNGWEIGLQGS